MSIGQYDQIFSTKIVRDEQRDQIRLFVNDKTILVGMVRWQSKSLIPTTGNEHCHALRTMGRRGFECPSNDSQLAIEFRLSVRVIVEEFPDPSSFFLEVRAPMRPESLGNRSVRVATDDHPFATMMIEK
jgi:hypothetical protein